MTIRLSFPIIRLHFLTLSDESCDRTKLHQKNNPKMQKSKDIFKSNNDLIGNQPIIYLMKILIWGICLFSGIFLSFCHDLRLQIFGAFFASIMMAHGIELQHQALHENGFNNRLLNRVVGFFLGLPLLISYSHYKDRHIHHHQYVGTDQDSEFFQYSKENDNLGKFIYNLFMIPHWIRVSAYIFSAFTNQSFGEVYNKKNENAIRNDYLIFGLFLLTSLLAIVLLNKIELSRIFLLFFCAAPIHTLIELPEHLGCEKDTDIFKNTRSIKSNWLMTWLTNGNNYHVEHHLIPSITPERLHILHERINDQILFKNNSYTEFIAKLMTSQN